MKKRIIIGIALFIAFLALAILDIFWLNFAIFGAILALAFIESLSLYEISGKNLALIALAFFSLLPFLGGINDVFKVILLNVIVVASVLAYIKSESLKIVLPFLYPTAPIFMMFVLYQNYGMVCLFWLIFSVVVSDSGAYFVGKFFGKRSFSPASPNKTLEGVLGGVILGSVLGSIFGIIFMDMAFFIAAITSFLVCVFGVFGDLFESYLKRLAGVKDSGHVLGEQGGILDRMDGYLFGVVAMFLVVA